MGRNRLSGAWLAVGLSLVAGTPAAVWASGGADDAAEVWAGQVWDATVRGDHQGLSNLLSNKPAGVDADGRLAKAVELLQKNLAARETKRAEEIKRAGEDLDKSLAEKDGGDFALCDALKAAVELRMVSPDKDAVMKEPRVKGLIDAADKAAHAAEARGDWLGSSELYYRLDLLLDDHGTYHDDVTRETQRLAMIRMYAPKRLWELRNERRNQEIAWADKHPTPEDEKKTPEQKAAAHKPLPPYNAAGDDFREKLQGIDEDMVMEALRRSYQRHVERTPMVKMLRDGVGALRTLVETDDLKTTFPGLADAGAKAKFLRVLDELDGQLAKPESPVGVADLISIVPELVSANEETIKLPKTALLHEFGNGGMSALDEFSVIIWPDEIRRFKRNTEAHFKGVGIQIEMDPAGNIRVVTPLDDTPAQRAGIRPGDLIKKVDGQTTAGFSLDQAVDVITGPGDTKVTLGIEREVTDDKGEKHTEDKEFTLARKDIPIITVKGWKRAGVKEDAWDWFIDPQDKIGYVRLTQFADRTDEALGEAAEQMKQKGLNALILDLRFDPGGLLDQAVAVTSRFVDRAQLTHNGGMVVTTHTKDNQVVQQDKVLTGHATLAGIPVVVLINEGSASASEIVSGAIQDYATSGDVKAVLMGARSYGKGSVQNVWPLPGGADALLKVTTQYYHLPGGRIIHRLPEATKWGVEPNLTVEMLPNQITDAFVLRQNADVNVEDKGKSEGTEKSSNPDDLIAKGMDLQLEEALVVLQAEVAAKGGGAPTLVEKSGK